MKIFRFSNEAHIIDYVAANNIIEAEQKCLNFGADITIGISLSDHLDIEHEKEVAKRFNLADRLKDAYLAVYSQTSFNSLISS